MPARPHRLRELHDHLARATAARPPDLQIALRRHPDWPRCSSCRFPLDPAAGGGHPSCDPDLEQLRVRVCGGGHTEVIVASHCRRCSWSGPLWNGVDQPPLDDAAHRCPQ